MVWKPIEDILKQTSETMLASGENDMRFQFKQYLWSDQNLVPELVPDLVSDLVEDLVPDLVPDQVPDLVPDLVQDKDRLHPKKYRF